MARQDEFELIAHPRMADCALFAVDLIYRPFHFHNELELCYVLSGSGKVSDSYGSYSIASGDILLFDSRVPHELTAAEPQGLRLLALQVSKSFCKRYFPQMQNIRFSCCLLNKQLRTAECQEISTLLRTVFEAYFDPNPEEVFGCAAALNLLFRSLLRYVPYQILSEQQVQTHNRKTERLKRLLGYIEDHFREPIRLQDLAQIEKVSETHLSHFFREELQISFQDYLSRIRLEAAMELLRTTEQSVTDIAYSCGFSDPKYLNQSFKKYLQTTPREWRSRNFSADDLQHTPHADTLQQILPDDMCLQLVKTLI